MNKIQSTDIQFDPVENKKEFKKIENELERKIDIFLNANHIPKNTLGYCHAYWEAKKMILKKCYNIEWKSPEELNPAVIFD